VTGDAWLANAAMRLVRTLHQWSAGQHPESLEIKQLPCAGASIGQLPVSARMPGIALWKNRENERVGESP
jgi:hypothetical protein